MPVLSGGELMRRLAVLWLDYRKIPAKLKPEEQRFGMQEIWIIGAGKFGCIAFKRLSALCRDRHFVLVDPIKENLLSCPGPNSTLEIADGVEFLQNHLDKRRKPEWIIPALPVHLAAEWLLLHLGPNRLRRVSLPVEIETLVPNPMRGPEGNIYVSHADFRCPDNCDEPSEICTITGVKRKQDMYAFLGALAMPPFKPLAIRSHQLGPGIGGYRPEQLFKLRAEVTHIAGAVLLSTACRCHGVMTGLAGF
jgi:hypothetical protein